MKQNKGPLLILTILTLFVFKYNVIIQESVLDACEVFITKLFPSLFPMMIITDCFLYFGLPDFLVKLLGKPFQKCFHTSPYGVYAFFISCFSGTPTNAYTIKNLVNQNYLREEEASHLLFFTFFSNPLFLYTMFNLIFPGNFAITLKLLFLPYLVNILLGILSKSHPSSNTLLTSKEHHSFGVALTKSIKNSMNTLLMILGTVSIFFVLNAIINPEHIPIISGLLEISQGLNSLIGVDYSLKIKEIITVIIMSFGGLSIHLQIKGILSDTNISYTSFLKGRIYQTLISVLLVLFI